MVDILEQSISFSIILHTDWFTGVLAVYLSINEESIITKWIMNEYIN